MLLEIAWQALQNQTRLSDQGLHCLTFSQFYDIFYERNMELKWIGTFYGDALPLYSFLLPLQWSQLFKESICSYRSKFFPSRVDPCLKVFIKGTIQEVPLVVSLWKKWQKNMVMYSYKFISMQITSCWTLMANGSHVFISWWLNWKWVHHHA